MILIDYVYVNGEYVVGYVMGLNSVIDYWDMCWYLFYDLCWGVLWEGGGDVLFGLKLF